MNDMNNQKVIDGFMESILMAQKQITYKPQFMDHKLRVEKSQISFMNIVDHPKIRIVLKPGEFGVTRSVHPLPRYADTTNVILMRGTEYGLIAMFGIESLYSRHQKTGACQGPTPHLHAPRSFLMAAMRFFQRKGVPFSLVNSEHQLLNWIFSDSFAADLKEQANIDKTNRIELGDGMLPKPPFKPKAKPAPVKNLPPETVPA